MYRRQPFQFLDSFPADEQEMWGIAANILWRPTNFPKLIQAREEDRWLNN